jgi:hypothetical protein
LAILIAPRDKQAFVAILINACREVIVSDFIDGIPTSFT